MRKVGLSDKEGAVVVISTRFGLVLGSKTNEAMNVVFPSPLLASSRRDFPCEVTPVNLLPCLSQTHSRVPCGVR